MFNAILNSLAPVILVVTLGFFLRKHTFLPQDFFKGLNKLVYWVGLPTLLVVKIGTATLSLGPVLKLSAVLLIGTTILAAITWLLSYQLPLPPGSRGAFIQASFRGNQAFVGLPIILYSLEAFPAATNAETLAIVCIGPMVVYFNVLAIPALLYTASGDNASPNAPTSWFKPLLINPLLIACFLGLVISAANIPLARFVERSMLVVGQMSLPLALLAIGAGLSLGRLKGQLHWSFLVCCLKCVLAPAIGYGLCVTFQLDTVDTLIALIYMATPTAVASYVLAQQLGGDEDLAGSTVVMSTVFSMVPLAVIIGWLS